MTVVQISREADIVNARNAAKYKAREIGFGFVDQTRISTAVSELARNVYMYAGGGETYIEEISNPHPGIRITLVDKGPGIEDVEQALSDGWSSSGNLGKGLPGAQRLADRLEIDSTPGQGTSVVYERWLKR